MWPNCRVQSNEETLVPYSPKTAFSCLREPAVAFSGSAKHSVPHDAKKLGFQTGIFIASPNAREEVVLHTLPRLPVIRFGK